MSKNAYSIVITEDGSPSLFWSNEAGTPPVLEPALKPGELMHHKGGALSESQEIYGKVVQEGFAAGLRRVISVGLGLGYNEFLVAQQALSGGEREVEILSYESDAFLVESLKNFFLSPACESSRSGDLDMNAIYAQILELIAPGKSKELFATLKSWLQNGQWQIEAALSSQTLPQTPYQVVLYDAFSARTSPELWSETFLHQLMSQALAPQALFSTYACTGALKRSLKANGFAVVIRDGFHGKRNSTLGRRGF